MNDNKDIAQFYAVPQGPKQVQVIDIDTTTHGAATAYQLALWLAQRTQSVIYETFYRNDGTAFTLVSFPEPTLPFSGKQRLSMGGRLFAFPDHDPLDMYWVICFTFEIPGTQYMRVVGQCREAAAQTYFDNLVADIRHYWKCAKPDINAWLHETVEVLTTHDMHQELDFKGTPYDFSGAVSDFIGEYHKDPKEWTACTIYSHCDMAMSIPDFSVIIECPTERDDGIPASLWVTARRLPIGTKLIIEAEEYDYIASPLLQAMKGRFIGELARWGWIAHAETGDGAAIEGRESPPAEEVTQGGEGEETVKGGKYGTCRDLSLEDVKAIIIRCKAFQKRGGKVPDFYDSQNITQGEPRSYELETLRGWLKDPKFS